MRYLSLFSGIEACSAAWKPLGWTCVAVAEIEPFPAAVLAHHYPGVPNLGDVTAIADAQIAALGSIDLVVGGSPCQDLSVAGKRAGLAGERSSLFHEQVRIFHAARTFCGARFLLWENVPGAFSSHGGRDFGIVVGSMAGCELGVPRGGWGTCGAAIGSHGLVEWRVLDAQYVRVESHPRAVPQRRRRVFALLDTGDWRDRPPILLEPEGLRGHPAPRREAGQGSAAKSLCCSDGGIDRKDHGADAGEIAPTLRSMEFEGSHANGGGQVAIAFHNRQDPDVSGSVTHPLGAKDNGLGLAFDAYNQSASDVTHTLRKGWGSAADDSIPQTITAMQVRRLTPRECERLQGFPDDYTLVPVRGKPAADGPRYRALGNSMAVPVMRFIADRISMVMKNENVEQ